MLKNLILITGSLSLIVMMACSSNENMAGGTIDPNTLALNSSSSNETSSSSSDRGGDSKTLSSSSHDIDVDPITMSSSSDDSKNLEFSSSSRSEPDIIRTESSSSTTVEIIETRNFSIQCLEEINRESNGELIVVPDLPEPSAYKSVEGDSTNVTLSNIYFDVPCNADQRSEFLESTNASTALVADTLYVTTIRSKGVLYDCGCIAIVDFTLSKEYSFGYTVFDQKEVLPVKE